MKISIEIFGTHAMFYKKIYLKFLSTCQPTVMNSGQGPMIVKDWPGVVQGKRVVRGTTMKNSTKEGNGDETNNPSGKPLVNNTPRRFIWYLVLEGDEKNETNIMKYESMKNN